MMFKKTGQLRQSKIVIVIVPYEGQEPMDFNSFFKFIFLEGSHFTPRFPLLKST
jgi:hypothetical protein